MVRTQVYLTEQESQSLKKMSAYTGKSQSELIREAVDGLLKGYDDSDWHGRLMRVRGVWEKRTDLPDFDVLRKEFERVG